MKKIEKFIKVAQDYRDSNIDIIEVESAFKELLKPKRKKARKMKKVKHHA